ncbi:hypothetical protein Tco_1362749 [Tanacetum coccineum]
MFVRMTSLLNAKDKSTVKRYTLLCRSSPVKPISLGCVLHYPHSLSKTCSMLNLSAYADDIAVQSCFFDIRLTNLSPRNCIPTDVLLRVSMHSQCRPSENVLGQSQNPSGYQSPHVNGYP